MAARLPQPGAEQPHAAVAQCSIAQLQAGQAGVSGQQSPQGLTATLCQSTPLQPAGRAAEKPASQQGGTATTHPMVGHKRGDAAPTLPHGVQPFPISTP